MLSQGKSQSLCLDIFKADTYLIVEGISAHLKISGENGLNGLLYEGTLCSFCVLPILHYISDENKLAYHTIKAGCFTYLSMARGD